MIELILTIIFASSGVLILLLLILIFIQKFRHNRAVMLTKKAREYFYQLIHQQSKVKETTLSATVLFDEFFKVEDQIKFSSEDRANLLETLPTKQYLRMNKRMINHIFPYKRILASQHLSWLQNDEAKDILVKRLQKERKEPVKFYLVYGLLTMLDEDILQLILSTCQDASSLYIERVIHLLSNHYNEVYNILTIKKAPTELELFLYASVTKKHLSFDAFGLCKNYLSEYLTMYINDKDSIAHKLRTTMLEALLLRDEKRLSQGDILSHIDFEVRKFGYLYLSQKEELKNIKLLLNQIHNNEDENKFITNTILSAMKSNKLFDDVVKLTKHVNSSNQKKALASILSSKIDYLIIELDGPRKETAVNAIAFTIKEYQTAGLIAFLNRNKNIDLEKQLFFIIQPLLQEDEALKKEFTAYLSKTVLKRNQLKKTELLQPKKEKIPIEKAKITWMMSILMFSILLYPLLSFASQRANVFNQAFSASFQQFILDTNTNLIFYFMAANIIYLLLLLLSLKGAKKQRMLWNIKSEQLLYEEDILPAISIIAPAYNEELNIITSVQSLLNLKYPAYEVIVVNDGSKDQTLQKLIDHFELKREDANYTYALQTKEIRGIYTNKRIPNLKIINKVNGGKADALNVGINIASNPYVCGIDADSVLEQEALLRLMSITLDNQAEPVALGGNIVPANGCTIDHGYIEKKQLPKELITRFQSLEYLRAFTSGRIGWSSVNSLLIISGAFGLFHKKDIINIGGYITSTGVLKKDSVGEDMELVVRLTNQKLKQKESYLISYVYHANCYTELPSDTRTLLKQRNRWHRGLIDILSYHRHLFLNPKYKQIGLFAIPYFYVFEVMGPFYELIGYIALIVSLILGFLAPSVVLAIFLVSIVMGIVLSLASLYIAETVNTYTTKKDVFVVLLFAFLENIGYRQFISMHRVYSFFTALFENGTWGEQKRKGM